MSIKHLKLDLTNNCNLKCEFCPYHWLNSCKNLKKINLDFEKAKENIFNWWIKFNSVQLSGSWESLLHPDFKEIILYIRWKVDNLRIITNWTLVDKNLDCLVNNFDKIIISLHWWELVHNNIVRNKGAYKKVINWILLLKKKWFKNIKINYVLTEKNIYDVFEVIKFSKNYGIAITFSLDFLPNIDKYIDKVSILLYIISYIKNNGYEVNPNLDDKEIVKYFTNKAYIIDPNYCDHIYKTIEIQFDWSVNICRSNSFWNIFQKKILEIVNDSKRLKFLETIKREISSKEWLSNPRCYRCCYQKPKNP